MASFKELTTFQKAFQLSMYIFEISKKFPKEEAYSLTDQIRRSSRSVCANFAEAYRKRRYPAHFISKLTDCDSENAETQVWLEFAFACHYIDEINYKKLMALNEETGKLLGHMIQFPEKYLRKN